MSLILFIQYLGLLALSFVPVWAGGQARKCYEEGNTIKSAACVVIAMIMVIGFVLLGMAAVRYNFSFVTILAALSL